MICGAAQDIERISVAVPTLAETDRLLDAIGPFQLASRKGCRKGFSSFRGSCTFCEIVST